MDKLQTYRQEIDHIDKQLIELLAKRFDIIKKVGKYKKDNNIPPLQSSRWQEVLDIAKKSGEELGMNPIFIGIIWNTIHEFALDIEKNV
ncbi:MAG: chorismate mutase [Candidatus Gracilibacteria bacterium]|nr:chorismate mutase [Candidatus Gracilibacteria bacterium]MDD3120188.1 chorismate mutase [Candidatus Gracilibacteria bacterium]MDD4531080.1 chorismate mutase [Candidatus Gracilibacteria bacterium]